MGKTQSKTITQGAKFRTLAEAIDEAIDQALGADPAVSKAKAAKAAGMTYLELWRMQQSKQVAAFSRKLESLGIEFAFRVVKPADQDQPT